MFLYNPGYGLTIDATKCQQKPRTWLPDVHYERVDGGTPIDVIEHVHPTCVERWGEYVALPDGRILFLTSNDAETWGVR